MQKSKLPVKLHVKDGLLTAAILTAGTIVSALLLILDNTGGFVNMIFVLTVVLVARLTNGYMWGVLASFIGVICVNYIFTFPYLELNFTMTGYPLTFITMLSVSIIVSTLTSQIKQQEQLRMETERETMRANLLRAVSHDLRTPLTSIAGSTSAVLENDDVLTKEQRSALLRSVRDEAEWLIRMVENLLSITRISDEKAQLHKELEVVEEVLASVAVKFQKRFPSIHLILTASEEPLFVPMDAILIEQVIINLLENAAYHGHCQTIQLFASGDNDTAIFTVQDDGTGIPEELLPKLFTSTISHSQTYSDNKRRNMGIGLSVCSSIVKAHGGKMMAHNAAQGGAVFRFTLPMEKVSQEDMNYED